MSNLLQALTEDAVSLTETELPSPDQVRTVLGALVKHVEQLETKLPASIAAPVKELQTRVVPSADTTAASVAAPAGDQTAAGGSTAAPAAPAAAPAVVDTGPAEQLAQERKAALTEVFTRLEALL